MEFPFSMKEQACNFIKKEIRQRCFSLNVAKILRTPFLIKQPQVAASDKFLIIP